MKLLKTLSFFAAAATVFSWSSCGQKGDTGPVGPQGPAGNANVYVVNYTITQGQWLTYLAPNQPQHSIYFEQYVPQLTQQIIDYGMTAAYVNDPVLGWATLPYTVTGVGVQAYYNTYRYLNYFGVDISLSNLQTPPAPAYFDVKLVIVDGLVRQQNPDLDWSNYEMVRKRLHLKD
ncbi:MAG TPA: hypothetical protein VFW78_09775 [Bacteroidia bacterium]|nr:hypothetical protein [Bacteroidia bacterium]